MRRLFGGLLLALMLMTLAPAGAGVAAAAPAAGKVYVVRVDRFTPIDVGMAAIARRIFEQAEADPDAAAVALVIDTPGGLVSSALAMKETILRSKLRTVAYVADSAWSAGALIATAAEKLYMHPGSSMGAAEPRTAGSTEPADYKTLSAVSGAFAATAQARGRDPGIAVAMVDKNRPIPGQKAELLTLTFQDAVEKKYADGVADSLEAALKAAGIQSFTLVDPPLTLSDRLARLLTTPWVATLLLVVGVIAIGIEFVKPGVTLPGLVGVVSLGLFFLGNVLVGTANWLEVGLALLGALLLVIEAFIPGFGIFGFAGTAAIGASIFLAVPTADLAVQYLAWTAGAGVIAMVLILRGIGRRGLGRALTLEHDARGYVPARTDLALLLDCEGKAVTTLRPAGTARFGSERVDVVTEGEFLAAGAVVKVIRVDGTRVVVRSVE